MSLLSRAKVACFIRMSKDASVTADRFHSDGKTVVRCQRGRRGAKSVFPINHRVSVEYRNTVMSARKNPDTHTRRVRPWRQSEALSLFP